MVYISSFFNKLKKLDISTKNNNIALKARRYQSFSSLKRTEIGHFKYKRKYCAEGAKILTFLSVNWSEICHFNYEE